MKKLLFTFLLALSIQAFADNVYRYSVDLVNVVNDQVSVSLEVPTVSKSVMLFHFPATIPGTYATEDYGRFIADFQALDANGKALAVKKISNNSFEITGATNLKTIRYKVDDSFDTNIKKDKIFEPAGTNIEAGKNYVFNNSGFFGFLEGMEKLPVELSFQKPSNLYGVTAMQQTEATATTQKMRADDYHQLVDCPILFAKPDTVSFRVNNTHVTLSVYAESGNAMAKEIYGEMKASMEAIAKFLPALPVDRYAFLIYVADLRQYKDALTGNITPGKIIQLLAAFGGKGFGALEHGNSSLYYMPEFGIEGMDVKDQMKDVAIHEFMHIITPLGLHSQHIGDFNYVKPVMSRHLWLYEGITEYFAGLIQVQAGLMTEKDYTQNVVRTKIASGSDFPISKMSMTEMSAQVLEKPYHKQYAHVYDRGAILGLLLDAEIIRLTDAKKTLKDVVLTLRNRYGANKSFEETTFIKEFVAEVHPDLQKFFDTYISGRTDWDLKNLSTIGMEYKANAELQEPKNPMLKSDNDVRLSTPLIQMGETPIKVAKVGKKEWAGIQVGDEVVKGAYATVFKNANGDWLKEGETANFPVKRAGKEITLPVKVTYTQHKYTHYLQIAKNPTEAQKKYRAKWLGQ
ncbi:MAG: hypothetical protein ACKVTZ_01690 [Bacteroidia bacterium]